MEETKFTEAVEVIKALQAYGVRLHFRATRVTPEFAYRFLDAFGYSWDESLRRWILREGIRRLNAQLPLFEDGEK